MVKPDHRYPNFVVAIMADIHYHRNSYPSDGRIVPVERTDADFLLNRESQRRVIEDCLVAVASKTSVVVVVSGEPGIGKTHLARWAADRARDSGFEVYWSVACEDLLPFELWGDILPLLLDTMDEDTPESSAGSAALERATLRRAFSRDLDDRADSFAGGAEDRLSELAAGAAALLRNLGRPVCIVFDDLQWADSGDLRILRRVVETCVSTPLLLICTMRDHEVPEASAGEVDLLLASVARRAQSRILRLSPLEPTEARRLYAVVAGGGEGGIASDAPEGPAWADQAGGNPLFVVELARQRLLVDRRRDSHGRRMSVPEGVCALVADRLRRLSRAAGEVIRTAALLGESFEWDILEGLFGTDRAMDLAAALDELAWAYLVEENAGSAGAYRFRHSLVRSAILATMSATAAAAGHRRIAERLDARSQESSHREPERVLVVFRHLMAAGALADADMVHRYALDAARAWLGNFSPARAIQAIDEGLSVGPLTVTREAEILHLRGIAATEKEDGPTAEEALTRAFDLYLEAGDRDRAVQVALTAAFEFVDVGVRSSWMWADRGLPTLRQRALALVGPESADYIRLLAQADDRESRLRALTTARARKDPDLELFVTTRLAHYDYLNLDFESAEALTRRAAELCDRTGSAQERTRQLYTEVGLLMMTGAPEAEFHAGIERLFHHAHRIGSLSCRREAELAMANRYAHCGNWDQVHALCGSLLKDWDPSGRHTTMEMDARRILYYEHVETGTDAPFDARFGLLPQGKGGLAAQVREAYLDGRLEPLKQRKAFAARARNFHAPWHFAGYHLFLDGRTACLLGDVPEARRWLKTIEPWGRLFGYETSPFASGTALGLRGELLRFLGRLEESVRVLEEADVLCRRAGRLVFLAWNLVELGKTLILRDSPGDRSRAAELLDEASRLCAELRLKGVAVLAERARQGLRRGGGGGPPRRRRRSTDPAGLSEREVEVLTLVARGYTNREIGEDLCISRHTVARHIHAILEKTGMSNRAEASAYAVRHGMD